MIVCIYLEIYAYISQKRTEPHVSTVNTMTEALDFKRPDILNSLTGNKKKRHRKNI